MIDAYISNLESDVDSLKHISISQESLLELFYNITNSKVPENVDLQNLKNQLKGVVEVMKEININSKKPYKSKALGNMNEGNEDQGPAILVVDDLGVITYQLKVLLSRLNLEVDCSQEIYDAVNKFKRRRYNYVVMDFRRKERVLSCLLSLKNFLKRII